RAPSRELRTAFEKFKEWLTQIYATVQKLLGKERLSEDIRQVFDSLLATDRQLLFSPRGEDRPALSLPRNELADVMRLGLAPQMKRDLARGMEKALSDLVTGEPVDVGPVLRESEALSRAYDLVRDDPLGGDPNEVLATLTPEDIENIFVHRGPAVLENGVIKVQGASIKKATGSRSGYGLVKIMFLHHGLSDSKKPAMPGVSKEDIMNMPRLIREWESIEESFHRVWRIPHDNGLVLSIVAAKRLEQDGSMLVSMYWGEAKKKLSKKKASVESSPAFPGGSRDTDQGFTESPLDGQQKQTNRNITNTDVNSVNATVTAEGQPAPDFRTEAPDAIEPAPPLERNADTAVTAEAQRTQAFEENLVAEIERRRQEGTLSEDDLRELDAARQETERALQQDELGQSALECLWNVTE
ncbi:MAG: hypothetical protein IJU37_09470, partial [Desulfovibrio sp.]|nr:hypothetical protein [Desulfovibrio sp.]